MINRLKRQLFIAILTLTCFSTFSASIYACIFAPDLPICAVKCIISSPNMATCLIGSNSHNDSTPIIFKGQ
ncbi:hypothetical protein BDD30_2649 [Photorhabdus asymbiotica]|uniref:Secreted protein n=1 Tax=Photorhabdus asymbiotica TaxID=291112 RepID=A0ABX9SM48_9GAMM|nr:hypothetical protein BDD30_2649 [Photorhabdus asymbiotica]